ncbi:MAG TPA: cache domain-containing protein, partial [Burkholderiales bacterium]|nr:cache domain-containing protein [Burkholderiales bacterium]
MSVPASQTLHPEDAAAREAQARRARQRLWFALALAASVLALTLIGSWTYRAVERSLRELRAGALRAVLDAQAKTLEVWIQDQELGIRRLARDATVRDHVRALVEIAAEHGDTPERYCTAPARRPLVAELDDALAGSGAVSFNLVDRSGRIIASKFREYCGLAMNPRAVEQELRAVFRGDTRFLRPYRDTERLVHLPANPPLARPVVWIETPVQNEAGRILAALGVGQYAHEQFAAILAAARSGESDEVYAFDRNGVMLSASRALGKEAALNQVLRVPGGGLTALAREAQAGAHGAAQAGMLLEPYAGYTGRPVVGAWRWLPAYDMGLAVEMSAAEAYAPLGVLRTVFGVVFGALVVAVLAA